jgi:site-specific DNA-methyltransferase (adenine-specific)
MTHTLHLGDCLDVLTAMADCSVDAVVTDPPYGFGDGKRAGFMGKRWDYDVPSVEVWVECLRVLKPGGHLLAFAGTRTQHRMACRIEDAGFEIRDMIGWVYGSGFPKSLDVSKAIDKAAGHWRGKAGEVVSDNGAMSGGNYERTPKGDPITAAVAWQGWGTALKPALEPITMARKPLAGTVAANVLEHGTGALNVDGCRVGTELRHNPPAGNKGGGNSLNMSAAGMPQDTSGTTAAGRWPANLIHDGSEEVVGLFPDTAAGGHPACRNTSGYSGGLEQGKTPHGAIRTDAGSAARFFYTAKASRGDRERGNNHPTVKPTDLMRYLCRLVTPPGGIVLDPFMGSGSTGKAALLEGFVFIGIEQDPDSHATATARLARAAAAGHQLGLGL